MNLHFFRRFKLAPHLWLNVSKRGVSITAGVRGLRATFGRRGTTLSAGLPGTGLSLRHRLPARPRHHPEDLGRRLLDKALSDK
ncbi:DUF4236 domain-containing protein [Phenylobacterium sp.]|uniref:DUF4236 domain-containing protein n=1 Tax=Phenylobacterium sp. TaxID=1871053 RepID=UPI00345BD718